MLDLDGLPPAQLVDRLMEEEAFGTLWCRIAWRERQRRKWAERYVLVAWVAGLVMGGLAALALRVLP